MPAEVQEMAHAQLGFLRGLSPPLRTVGQREVVLPEEVEMSPDQGREVAEAVVADVHPVRPDLLDAFLHVSGVPVYDGVQREAERAELLFLALLKRTPDFVGFAMVDPSAQTVTQFGVIELDQDTPPKRRVVHGSQDVDGLGNPADFEDYWAGAVPTWRMMSVARRILLKEEAFGHQSGRPSLQR